MQTLDFVQRSSRSADENTRSSSDSHEENDEKDAKAECSIQRPTKVLSKEDVIKIFTSGKPRHGTTTMKIWKRGQIVKLSREYNVTPKTIRDIWNRRTWKDLTATLVHVTHYEHQAKSEVSTIAKSMI
jgi:hypothetical protein